MPRSSEGPKQPFNPGSKVSFTLYSYTFIDVNQTIEILSQPGFKATSSPK
uniref:Uncharacterized protein n=1 Tax=Arundo donax TaxID=35708 RepID=A0A0A9AB57_ARUDO